MSGGTLYRLDLTSGESLEGGLNGTETSLVRGTVRTGGGVEENRLCWDGQEVSGRAYGGETATTGSNKVGVQQIL